jgi:hypothetical protein
MTQWAFWGSVALTAVFALPAIGLGQTSNPILVNLAATGPGGEPAEFTFARTGEGENGKWAVIGDPTAANGRALAQLSQDRTDYRFPLAIYNPYSGRDLEL